jgi:Uma2 family endonuclease
MKRTAAPSPTLLSLEDWADLGEDEPGELVDGVLEEEEMPTVLHELVVSLLNALLRGWARRRKGFALGSEARIAVGPRRGRKPDISVFLPPHLPAPGDSLIRVPPYLVVEVLSPRPRDVRRDRIDKLHDYAKARASYYWVVDPLVRTLEVFELDRARGRYVSVAAVSRGRVRVPGLGSIVLDLDETWKEIDEASMPPARKTKPARARR